MADQVPHSIPAGLMPAPTRVRGALGSILLHAAAIAAIWGVASRRVWPVPAMAPLSVVFEAAVPEQTLATAALPPPMAELVSTVDGLPARRVPAAVTASPPAVPRIAASRPPAPLPAAVAPSPIAEPASPPPASPAPDGRALAGLEARIRTAVQRAMVYPPLARLQHREGRAQIRFDYAGGHAEDVALATPSSSGLLDRAALSAVRTAAYPPPLPALEHERLQLLVWVDFSLTRDD